MDENEERKIRSLGYHACALVAAVEQLAAATGAEPEQIRIQLWRRALTRQACPSEVEVTELYASFRTAEAIERTVAAAMAREYTTVGEA